MKSLMYMVALTAIRENESEWHLLYQYLVPRRCHLDPETDEYEGKKKIFGYIIGEMINIIFHLLKEDENLCRRYREEGGGPPPSPELYNAEKRMACLLRRKDMVKFLAARESND
jgi:hypothetical protein